MKLCKVCKEWKSESDFYSAGNGYVRGECKTCKKIISVERQRNIMRQFREWKDTLSCVRCGFDDSRALQFHHNNDDKEGTIGAMVRHCSLETLLNEANKCEVLCANCHQIEHHQPL